MKTNEQPSDAAMQCMWEISRLDECYLRDSARPEAARLIDRAIAAAVADLRADIETIEAGLEKMLRDIPACDGGGGLYVVHHDPDGEELGTEPVDPLAVIQHLDASARALLQRHAPATSACPDAR